jgi:DNA-binding transcriptional LysR family regulator
VTVVNPSHPLASTRGVVSISAIARHVQLVLSDRTVLSEGRDFGVLSPLTWRLSDLGAKHAFLKAGLGWGHMPLHMVKADLDNGVLVKIRVEAVPRAAAMPMSVVFRKDAPPGPAGRAFIAQLKRK